MNKNLFKLNNVIKNYAWGSKTAIRDFFNIDNTTGEPQAEIWMGAHPDGCSKVTCNDEEVLLSNLIKSDMLSFLSAQTANRFGELPYLFKVLSAGSALSIQVHPSKQEAEVGFLKENALGIDRLASNRNYRDANHKPELVYALTPYQAMNGFRSFSQILSLFSLITAHPQKTAIEVLLSKFKANLTSKGLEEFFVGILSLQGELKLHSITILMDVAHKLKKPTVQDDVFSLIIELSKTYPEDIGLFSPLMLNVLTLNPGEAMYLDARTPHAYIKGTGLEVMANSDNVLRAGLTHKYIDIKELASCTSFKVKPQDTLIIEPKVFGNKQSYYIPVPDFKFDCYLKAENEIVSVQGAEIIFAIDSIVEVTHQSGEFVMLKQGESVFIPAYAKQYMLRSTGRIARTFS